MICNYSNTIAMKHGINSALIAGYISDCVTDRYENSQPWARVTQKSLMGVFPFMGEKAVRNALKRLRKANIITAKQFNKGHFDHGNFYTFTEYGCKILRGDDAYERKYEKD